VAGNLTSPFVIVLNDEGTYSLHVEPTPEALTHLAAKAVVFWGQKAIERRGVFHLALSGGSTPKALYELLATEQYVRQLFWDRVHVWWGDERNVPSDHADSNNRMARQALIEKVPIPPQNVHRVRTELGAAQAAAHYEAELMFAFGLMEIDEETGAILVRGEARPRFDLILLGLGDDGHTASLFPETEALAVQDGWVVANAVPKLHADRITFTYPLINAADSVLFLVSGAGKAATLKQVLLGDVQPAALPAQGVAPITGKLFWMCDAAAAARVAEGPGYPQDGEFIYRRMSVADG
jgi:6-phosphogluconolactonase